VKTIRDYLLQGAALSDILEQTAIDWPGVNVVPYIDHVFEGFATTARQRPEIVIGWCLEASRDLFRKMVDAADYAGGLAAIKEIAKIKEKSGDTSNDLAALLK
jgi:hypothetical protein